MQTEKKNKKKGVDQDEMTQGARMKRTRECPMALLVQMKGGTLINLVLEGSAGEEMLTPLMQTTITEKIGNPSLVKLEELVALVVVIGRTEVVKGEGLVETVMKNVGATVAVVAEVVGEEGDLVEVEEEENMTDIVEVIERECFAKHLTKNRTFSALKQVYRH